jgi:hypothetical protein
MILAVIGMARKDKPVKSPFPKGEIERDLKNKILQNKPKLFLKSLIFTLT